MHTWRKLCKAVAKTSSQRQGHGVTWLSRQPPGILTHLLLLSVTLIEGTFLEQSLWDPCSHLACRITSGVCKPLSYSTAWQPAHCATYLNKLIELGWLCVHEMQLTLPISNTGSCDGLTDIQVTLTLLKISEEILCETGWVEWKAGQKAKILQN